MMTLLTFPVSTCVAERSFSCMKRLKMPLRSTPSDERLPSLAVLHVHKHKEVNRRRPSDLRVCWEKRSKTIPVLLTLQLVTPHRSFYMFQELLIRFLRTLRTDRLKTFVRRVKLSKTWEGLSYYRYIVYFLNKYVMRNNNNIQLRYTEIRLLCIALLIINNRRTPALIIK